MLTDAAVPLLNLFILGSFMLYSAAQLRQAQRARQPVRIDSRR